MLLPLDENDGLGRTLSVAPPSGGSYQYSYWRNAVTVTDPAGKQRRNFTDALGRLVEVDEPGWGDGTAGKGSVTISGLELHHLSCSFEPQVWGLAHPFHRSNS